VKFVDKQSKPIFSQSLFWDIDIHKLDVDKYSVQVIERVLECGQWEDWLKIRDYYSLDKIKEVAISLRSLEPTAMTFISTITKTPLEEFRCYKLRQSNHQPWNY
jgi:hypothetical protein